ncbi:hypothetical protein [uncultured Bacteroides sp.]|uniref:hypothetical protein n=1 Tax=uncultured Bacteroides sp. TaxID=162156 RepID=UPI0025D79CA5|nr:hypothetical protein [uncultured Bacteroides sp.]
MIHKIIGIFSVLILFSAYMKAQDIIVMSNSEEIKAKVLSVSENEVVYKITGQSVERVLPKRKIQMIMYANGEKDVFRQNSVKYKLLDFYNKDDVKGIVIEITDGGYHGKILSLDEIRCKFYVKDTDSSPLGNDILDSEDGEENQEKFLENLKRTECNLADFPAYQWCVSKGDGWYLPSKEELMQLKALIYKGEDKQEMKRSLELFNSKLKEYHADAIISAQKIMMNFCLCVSSSQDIKKDNAYIWYVPLSRNKYTNDPKAHKMGQKWLEAYVRAMYRF